MSILKKQEIVIIGAGSAGLALAVGMAGLSKKVLLVSETVGGDCTHTGCVPSKRFLYLGRQYNQITDTSGKKRLKNQAFEDIRKTIHRIEKHDCAVLENPHITYVQGNAVFESEDRLKITPADGTTPYTVDFKTCYIATGSSPLIIPITGLPSEKIITSETLFQLKTMPESLCIIGGGPIGAEMATAFALFGIRVTMVIRSQLLPNEHPTIVAPVRNNLKKLGVTILEGISDMHYKKESDSLELINGDGKKAGSVTGSTFYLFALGRVPNTSLGLEKAHISYDRSGIAVSSRLKTSNRRVYALGDVTPYPKFTHLAYQHARNTITSTFLPFVTPNIGVLPAVTFTDPPVATVGSLIETPRIKLFEINLANTDRGLIEQSEAGTCIVAVDMLTGTVTGASIVGKPAEDLILFYTVLIQQSISIFKLGSLITAYPTYANSINMLYTAFLKRFKAEIVTQIIGVFQRNYVRITTAIFWISSALLLYAMLRSINFDFERLVAILFNVLRSPAGIFIYIALYSVRTLISFSAVILTVLGGVVYGFWGGLSLTLVASNLSSAVAYLLGKTVFATESKAQKGSLIHLLRKNAFETVLITRFTFFPYDLLSYICGALRIPFPAFILATAIGSIPGTIAFTSFGAGITNLEDVTSARLEAPYILLGLGLLIFSLIVSYLLKKRSTA